MIFLFVFVQLNTLDLFAIEKDNFSFDVSLPKYSILSEFQKIPGYPNCCSNFEKGDGNGVNFGLFYNFNSISQINQEQTNFLNYNLGLVYNQSDYHLEKNDEIQISVNNKASTGVLTHNIDMDFVSLGIAGNIEYFPIKYVKLAFGFSLSSPIISKKFSQIEYISNPKEDGVFIDSLGNPTGKRYRNEFTNIKFPFNDFLELNIIPKIGFNLPLFGGKVLLNPNISYNFPIIKYSETLNLKVSSYNFSLSLTFLNTNSKINELTDENNKQIVPNIIVEKPKLKQDTFIISNPILISNESISPKFDTLDTNKIKARLDEKNDSNLVLNANKETLDSSKTNLMDNNEYKISKKSNKNQIEVNISSNKLNLNLTAYFNLSKFDKNTNYQNQRYYIINESNFKLNNFKNISENEIKEIFDDIIIDEFTKLKNQKDVKIIRIQWNNKN